jgi:hypothetical protein
MACGSELDTLDDVGHGSGAVRSKDLDGVDMGLLGNTVLLAGDGTGAMSSVTVAILISIASGDGLTPLGSALEVDVVGVGTGINDIGIDTLTTILGVEVLVEGTEVQRLSVRNTSKTPRGVLLGLRVALVLSDHVLRIDRKHGVDNGIPLDKLDIRMVSDLLNDGLVEVASVALEVADLEGVLHTREGIKRLTALAELKATLLATLMDVLNPGVVVRGSVLIDMVLELDDVGVGDLLGLDGAEDGG